MTSIVILTFNKIDYTIKCIESIRKYTSLGSYEIIIVDNASTDGSREFFENDSSINYIYSPENVGFGRANNLGTESAKGEFLFFLNSDTLFKENSLNKLYAFFTQNEKELNIGSLGCTLIDNEGKFNGDGALIPTCKSEIERLKSIIPIIKYFAEKVEEPKRIYNNEFYEIGYVIGADLMMKKELFQKLNGFDPSYFMYYEESDLQSRMKNLGYKAYIYTGTEIIHLEDGSGKQIKKYNNRKRIIAHTSKNIFLRKNDAANFSKYKFWDKVYLFLSSFSRNYTREEKTDFINSIRKTH